MDEKEDRIRQRAHAIWEAEGRPEGRHEAHWQQACAELEGTGETEGSAVQMQGGEPPMSGGDAKSDAAPRTTRPRRKV